MTTEDPLEAWLKELAEKDEGQKRTEKQARILRAAVEVFAEKGYSGAATSEIAQRAEVAEGTIFRHYRTKKDLLYSIVAPFMAKLIEPFAIRDFNKVLDEPHPTFEGFVRAVIDNRIAFIEKNRKILRILIQEVPFHPELREQFLNRIGARVLERVVGIVDHYREQGQIADVPSTTAIRLLASSLVSFAIARFVVAPKGWNDEAEREETIRYVLRGLGYVRTE